MKETTIALPTPFSNAVCERMEFYVYILIDPRTNTVFYVGKGIDNRVFNHVKEALTLPINHDKAKLIREIYNEGFEVIPKILRHGITQELAYEIECACIDLLGLDNLTNIVNGHHSWERGLSSIDEINQLYDAAPVVINPNHPTVMININRLYRRHMTPAQLYDTTRQSWKIAQSRRQHTQYAIAEYRGVVREVYVIDSWFQVGANRWGFNGRIADPEIRDLYINKSVEAYRTRGSQNPIRYNY